MEDPELLRDYVEHRSDKAFAELVARHLNLVYSTAFRLVRESHLAKDVAQTVFIGLAQKPQSIRNPAALAGWLYRTTRFVAASFLRSEHRRHLRESIAMELHSQQADSASVWATMAPHLETAMDTLNALDQDAVAMRFFEGKSLREVGAALHLSEDAAQKRITRALEKLRLYFGRQGVVVTTTLMASVLASHAVQAAPPGLIASVTALSLTSAAGGGTTAFTLKLLGLMTATNLKITTAAVLLIAAISTPIIWNRQAKEAKSTRLVEREPGRPAKSPATGLAKAAPQATTPKAQQTLLEQLMESPKLSTADIEAYLEQNKRNAESLLAAFRVSGDRVYLREAAEHFTKNPAVQFAAIAFDLFPDQRRQWIENFKARAADNSLAWYFSALDYFKTKQANLGIQEIAEATRKQSFQAYVTQTSQAVEEMYNLAGRSALEAKHASACGAPMPHLMKLKDLANEVLQTQQSYRDQGDTASADLMTSMGLVLGDRLGTGANNQFIIDQLMGIAIEQKFLGKLDPALNYDFLSRPVNELSAEIDRRKQAIKQAAAYNTRVLPTLNETELANYLDRLKVYGEPEAHAWLQSKHGQP